MVGKKIKKTRRQKLNNEHPAWGGEMNQDFIKQQLNNTTSFLLDKTIKTGRTTTQHKRTKNFNLAWFPFWVDSS